MSNDNASENANNTIDTSAFLGFMNKLCGLKEDDDISKADERDVQLNLLKNIATIANNKQFVDQMSSGLQGIFGNINANFDPDTDDQQ